MHPARPRRVLAVAGLTLALFFPASSTLAASSSVECGQLMGYTAPEPLGPADGSLTLGFTPAWTIDAAASVGAIAMSILPTIVGTAPTCLSLDVDDAGRITSVDLAAEGHLHGPVAFDGDTGFYIFANRLIVPTFVTDAVPSLAALFVTAFQAGADVSITFGVDVSTGLFNGFDGTTEFCGLGSITTDGDGRVGDAIIVSEVLDAADLAALAGSGSRTVCASVHSVGTIDSGTGAILGTADVTMVVQGTSVTPPPTDAINSTHVAALPGSLWTVLLLGTLSALAAIVVLVRRPRSSRTAR